MTHTTFPGGHTASIWHGTAEVPEFRELRRNVTADVCIVGAGIAGLSTAYMLAKAGKKVVVLDDGPIGGGESGRSEDIATPERFLLENLLRPRGRSPPEDFFSCSEASLPQMGHHKMTNSGRISRICLECAAIFLQLPLTVRWGLGTIQER